LIYLIRHTTPLVAKGICYGQTDLDVTDTFLSEAEIIKNTLPKDIKLIYSSPLQRCSKLATTLFPDHHIAYEPHLMELNCGTWEMQHWDDIPKQEIDPWMSDFVNVAVPSGESYMMLYNRIVAIFEEIISLHKDEKIAIIAHGGVLRSILSYITQTSLLHSFDVFKIHYGCVVEIKKEQEQFAHQMLSNIETTKEQHEPSNY
jgi:alpha-ribazole phosphatase